MAAGKLWPEHLVQFGQIGYIQIKCQVNKKWVEKSTKCIMAGYANDHSLDTYQIYDSMSGMVQLTHDVCWAITTHRSMASHITQNASDSSGRQCLRSGKYRMNTFTLPHTARGQEFAGGSCSLHFCQGLAGSYSAGHDQAYWTWTYPQLTHPSSPPMGHQRWQTYQSSLQSSPTASQVTHAWYLTVLSTKNTGSCTHNSRIKSIAPTLADVYLITCGSKWLCRMALVITL